MMTMSEVPKKKKNLTRPKPQTMAKSSKLTSQKVSTASELATNTNDTKSDVFSSTATAAVSKALAVVTQQSLEVQGSPRMVDFTLKKKSEELTSSPMKSYIVSKTSL